jgi:uncharacterized protein YktB (UPF0637 family)
MHKFLSIFLVVFFFACSNTSQRNTISKGKMEILLWEQMKLDAYLREFVAIDSTKNLSQINFNLQQNIFKKYEVSNDEFYRSYNYYLTHDDEFKNMIDNIVDKKTKENQIAFQNRMSKNRIMESNIFLKDIFVKRPAYSIRFPLSNDDISNSY